MHLRPTAILLTFGLTLAAVTGCSEQVKGSAAADPNAAEATTTAPSTPKKPSTSSSPSKPADPTAKQQADIKITKKKKTAGLETCGVLTKTDIEAATGGKSSADGGCIHATTGPSTVITQMVTVPEVADQDGEKKQIEIGGNTAWQISSSKEDCQVTVMLTDDPSAITSAFSVSVVAIEELDACAAALKLATQGFEHIPDA